MGNRAVITTEKNWERGGIGIYMHWNGGRDSVQAFCDYCRLKQFRSPEDSYGMARMIQVISNFFGGGLSIGVDMLWRLDCYNYDNGVYILDEDWNIVGRKWDNGDEQNSYNHFEMLAKIDQSQPKDDQLGENFFKTKEVTVSNLKLGDEVYLIDYCGKVMIGRVIGFGADELVNGQHVLGVPYTNIYGHREKNIDNYLRSDKYRIRRGNDE